MLAYRLLQPQTQPEFQEVPELHAGRGQVVVKVAGSGLCHTDFTVISRDRSYWKDNAPPFTLGHEIAGWVEEVGTGVTHFRHGDAVAVNPSWASCGRCHMCRSGEENSCLYQKAIRAPCRLRWVSQCRRRWGRHEFDGMSATRRAQGERNFRR